jgi:outer membrane lipoprotein-sorting protein
VFKQSLKRFLTIIASLLLLAACSTTRPALDYTPGATLDTLSAAVSMSVVTADNGMSGSGFMVYRRPDQLHLVLLSPFGTTLMEIFSQGEQVTLLYPGSATAYVGTIADLPEKGGLQGWRLMRWVMDAAPSPSSETNGTVERAGVQGLPEKVTYENGLVVSKSTADGEQVYYSRYTVAGGVPFAAELELRNAREDRIRIVLDEPEVNTLLEEAVFQPRLDGIKILPLSLLRGISP